MDYVVLEAAYEVGNKVGGIHTVLTSKSARMMERIKEFYEIGPYYEKKAQVEFEEKTIPEKFHETFVEMEKEFGVKCHYGNWVMAEQSPECILIDHSGIRKKINEIKKELWESFQIDSIGTDEWFNEPAVWGKALGLLIEKMEKNKVFGNKKIVAHFHEYLSGTGLLHLKKVKSKVKTVFTTHATFMGRTIAETKKEDLYELIEKGFKDKKPASNELAYSYGIQAKHLLEKASAQNADVFTSVSKAVAREAEFILGKKCDLILPNGLDMEKFPIMEDLSVLHKEYRNQIRHFVEAYFYPYYYFNIKNTMFYFIAGRYEFHNKGIDLFIDALGELNRQLKKEKSDKIVVAFLWVAEETTARNMAVMENMAIHQTIEELIERELPQINKKLFKNLMEGRKLEEGLFEKEFLLDAKKMTMKLKSKKDFLPPLSAFEMPENEILKSIKRNNLLNKEEDKIKVIYYPTYLSTADGLIGLNYYEAIIGSHYGVFPSYYEPWGYTPLETAALGVPSLTTDLGGFGQFIEENLGEKAKASIDVLKRKGKTYKEEVEGLKKAMKEIYSMTKQERMEKKIKAKEYSGLADWSNLIDNYIKAYEK
ncbi:glycogen/starch synthase [Candidatus Micrarchaeota archaeon]|nr:glycogen/starch synthase [Candidatus Micrarchaeota archaeon]MBU2476939.1 glycogen/starch synthase [Candidatus Micrarchaeota archaeon]